MKILKRDIEILSAPSILGLKPTGVDRLGDSLLNAGLAENLSPGNPVVYIPHLNELYSDKRDAETNCLNAKPIKDFSLTLINAISETIKRDRFALVLGGECSILLGIMPALKEKGNYGLIFLDAHADFYEPERSITGEVADMELAIVTGRRPELLANINNMKPYVEEKNVIHIGQRDWEETQKYGSQDIHETSIKCFDLATIEKRGIEDIITEIDSYIKSLDIEGCWIHYDTDVLADDINPAVDYRLPGGLQFEQVEKLVKSLLLTGKMIGMSITIFNPLMDKDGVIAKQLVKNITNCFATVS